MVQLKYDLDKIKLGYHFLHVLNVEVEWLKMSGPLFMVYILQLDLCLHELKNLVIYVNCSFFAHNIVLPPSTNFNNGVKPFCHRSNMWEPCLQGSHYGKKSCFRVNQVRQQLHTLRHSSWSQIVDANKEY